MTRRTENRIWRSLFLAALVGAGIAASAPDSGAGAWVGVCVNNNTFYALRSDGNLYRAVPVPGSSTRAWGVQRAPEVTGQP